MARIQDIPNPQQDANSLINWRNWKNLATITADTLSDDAIIKVPTTSTANVISPTLDVLPLTIRGSASQTADLLVIETSAGVDRFVVTAAGNVTLAGTLSFATIVSGAWNGTVIAPGYGGTGLSTYATGDLLYASSASAIARLAAGTNGHFLKVASGLPAWSALTSGEVTTALTFTPVNRAGDTMTGLLTLSADPSSALHAATKQYVDAISAGIQPKAAVACATTANITLSGEQTIDGVLTSASRVLVKDQTTGSQNGIYVSAAGAWARATDLDADAEAPGALVFVSGGTANGSTQWQISTPAPITVGTTSITWVKTFQAAAYVGGAGLTLSGLTFAVGTASASRIVVNADDIDLATTGIGAGTYTKITVDVYGRATVGTTLVDGDIPSALTGKTYNALTLTAQATGFTIAGGTASRTLTVAANANVSGTNTGDQTITLTGNVTGSGTGSFATTIAANAVTLAMMATIATDSFLGRDTAGTGNVEVLSVATVKTLLNLVGTNSGDQTIALTGAVTGSGTGSFATTLAADIVGNSNLRNSGALSVIGRSANSTGDPGDISAGTDAHVLRRSGTTLGFGTIGDDSITALAASKLTGSSLPAGITGSSLTSLGTLSSLTVAGLITANGGILVNGGTFAAGRIYSNSVDGTVIAGRSGSSYDFHIVAGSGNTVFRVPAGTFNGAFLGTLAVTSTLTTAAFLGIGPAATSPSVPLHATTTFSRGAEMIRLQTASGAGAAGDYLSINARHWRADGSGTNAGASVRFTNVDPTSGVRKSDVGLYGSDNEIQSLGLEVGPDGASYMPVSLLVATEVLTNAPVLGVAGEIGFGGTKNNPGTSYSSGQDQPGATPQYVLCRKWNGASWDKFWLQGFDNVVTP